MKTYPFFSFTALTCALILAACSPTDPSNPRYVVAQGKGVKITRGELDAEEKQVIEHMKRPGMEMPEMSPEEKAAFDARTLERMVVKRLIEAETAKIPSSEINKKVEENFAKVKSRFPDEKTFEDNLKKAGLTPDKIKSSIKSQVAMEKLVERRLKPEELAVTPEDVQKFYQDNPDFWKQKEQVRARHILVKVEPNATPEEKAAKKKAAEAARTRISKGEPFAKVAEEVSDDPGSKQKGGELPPFPEKGHMVSEFSEAAFKQKVGVLGPVFESKFGYHFIEVLERIAPRTIPFEEVKDQIEQRLKTQKRFEGVRKVIRELREAAQVNVKLSAPLAVAPTGPASPMPVPPSGHEHPSPAHPKGGALPIEPKAPEKKN